MVHPIVVGYSGESDTVSQACGYLGACLWGDRCMPAWSCSRRSPLQGGLLNLVMPVLGLYINLGQRSITIIHTSGNNISFLSCLGAPKSQDVTTSWAIIIICRPVAHINRHTEYTLRPRPPDQRWVPPSIEVRGNRGTEKEKVKLRSLSTRCHGGREERSLQSSCCSGCIQLFQDYDGIYAQFMVCTHNLPLLPNLMISDTIVRRKFSMRLSRIVNGWLCFDLSSLPMEFNLQTEIALMS